jgi:hypothetical protein
MLATLEGVVNNEIATTLTTVRSGNHTDLLTRVDGFSQDERPRRWGVELYERTKVGMVTMLLGRICALSNET